MTTKISFLSPPQRSGQEIGLCTALDDIVFGASRPPFAEPRLYYAHRVQPIQELPVLKTACISSARNSQSPGSAPRAHISM